MSEMLNDASKITWRSSKRMIENPFMLIHVWENKDWRSNI
jgi:hypothetical protein